MTGCATPLIAENELFGAQTPTPWSATNAQYRANVLALLQELGALGATPAITIANPPYTGGDAADWWREAAQAAILIRQVYFTSPGPKGLSQLGPARASRSMRKGMRGLVARFGAIGIPAGRVALELQFQSAPGQGGRQGLQPTSAWLEFVKLEALAAKQVAADTRIEGVWSWGWPSFSVAGNDPDKPAAACVYLWARDPKFCDAPARRRRRRSTRRSPRARSQLPPGMRCTLGAQTIAKADVGRAAALTGDLGSAATALLERVVLRADEPVDPQTVLAAERAIVRDRFGGSGSRYRAALAAAAPHAQPTRARSSPTGSRATASRSGSGRSRRPRAQVADFLATYAATNVRLVSVDAAGAVARRRSAAGFAVETIAPEQVFSLPLGKPRLARHDRRPLRRARARPVAAAVRAGACPRAGRRPRACSAASPRTTSTSAGCARARTRCSATRSARATMLPGAGDVDLTLWAPFLGA